MNKILNFLSKGSNVLMITFFIIIAKFYFIEDELGKHFTTTLMEIIFIGFLIVKELEEINKNTKK
jgi:hypothetical protein